MMLKTFLGPVESDDSVHYLRPETAQGIFVNFLNVLNTSRRKPPFGIAQIGKSFRNEITPGNFIFRTREFEQMEMEFFVEPGTDEKWHEYWLAAALELVRRPRHRPGQPALLRAPGGEAARTTPRARSTSSTGSASAAPEFAELEGIANRTDFDLTTHSKHSGTDLSYFDQATNTRYTPYVIEPAAGLTRAVLAFLLDAYSEDEAPDAKGKLEKRTVLRLDKRLAPVKAAVLPLSRNADLSPVARDLAAALRKHWNVEFDDAQAIGRRYRRQDEIGTPFCVTVDFDTLDDHAVTVRERDSMKQERIALDQVEALPRRRNCRAADAVSLTLAAAPLRLSDRVGAAVPVVLAPMAGITNTAFRRLCREQMARTAPRAVRQRDDHHSRAGRAEPEDPEADPVRAGRDAAQHPALRRRPGRRRRRGADDRRGGPRRPRRPELRLPGAQGDPQGRRRGAALADRAVRRHRARPRCAKRAARCRSRSRCGSASTPSTSRSARPGCARRTPGSAHVALHGRTAQDYYGGRRRLGGRSPNWCELLDIPVLGNGDIWEADDALRMVRETGCAGVVVGRGCLGRPWLFADLAAAFAGRPDRARPDLGVVAATMHRHAQLLADWLGEQRGVTEFRKHVAWYLKGFARRRRRCGWRWRRRRPWPNSATCWHVSTTTSRSRKSCSANPAAGPAGAGRWRCRRAGSAPGTRAPFRPAPNSPTAAAEPFRQL